jgi:hypothetical protein
LAKKVAANRAEYSHQSRRGQWSSKEKGDAMNNKYNPHLIVINALRAGNIIKPDHCSACNKIKIIIAHHDDYRFPLQIRWLCRSCHQYWHKSFGQGKNRELILRSFKENILNLSSN